MKTRIFWNWTLFRRYGFRRLHKDCGYWTEWVTPILPGLWLEIITEGPP